MQIDQAVVDEAVKKMNIPPMVPKKGGKEEMISGYNAELYTMMIDSAEEMSIWLTKGLPKDIAGAIRNCVNAGINFTGVKSDALMEMFKAGYAPVRFEMKQGGAVQFTEEFAKAEHKKLPDALFTVPSDIKVTKFDPSAMSAPPPDDGKK